MVMVFLVGFQLVVVQLWEAGEAGVRNGLERLRRDERGSVTAEQAVITSVLVVAALGVLYLIYDKVTAKAETINLDDRPTGGPGTLPPQP
jgi:Flp pilus assembly pilin Flp